MSAKIYYLRPPQRENLETPPAEPQAEEVTPQALPARAAGKRPIRGALPGGRNSQWKRKLGGGAVRRPPGADKKDSPSDE